MEVITYEIQQQVKVRKYNVDCKKLCNLLRTHKKLTGLNNKRIAELLNVSITKVEHWFRKDKCFSIPDEDVWLSLKQILNIATNDFDLAITTFEEKDNVFEKGNRIYDSQGIAPTITCGDAGLTILERIDTMEVKIIGQMDNTIDHTFESANRVYDKNGLSPTINCCGGGGLQPKIIDDTYANREPRVYEDFSPALRSEREGFKTIVAMRGRYTDGSEMQTEQRLEPNMEGVSNALTSVQKDNLVMENCIDLYNKNIRQDKCVGTLTTNSGTQFHCGSMGIIETISTKDKQIEVASTILAGYERTNMTGFNADNGVMEIKEEVINPLKGLTENGWHFEQNIYDTNGITRALKAGGGSGNIPKAITQYRIRKLTPRECWRLMDFTDEDFEKAAQVNSNTQLYKQAGNSIVKNVLVAIIGQMLPGKENIYKEN